MAEEVSADLTEVKASEDEKDVEKNKIDTMVSDLAQDYSKYLKVNVATEVTITEAWFLNKGILFLLK